MKRLAGALALVFPLLVPAQWSDGTSDSLANQYATIITVDELRIHLSVLASDEYQGRDTGKEGQKMAAEYIKEHFIGCGIPPVSAPIAANIKEGYYQPFTLIEERSGSISMASSTMELEFMKELLYFNEVIKEDRQVTELVYLGDGSTMSTSSGLEGKVALVTEPGTSTPMSLLVALRVHVENARKAGVDVVLLTSPRMADLVEQLGQYVSGPRMRLVDELADKTPTKSVQLILVDNEAMDGLLARKKLAKLQRKRPGTEVPVDFTIRRAMRSSDVVSENVLAYIEGSDKKEELIVITAHYDHIGIENGEVYNGADDDGSGTVAIMMIAEAFAKAKREGNGPRRSVLVMPVSGEEKGLLGSRYYSEHPVFPLENTVANLNIDMIGRVDSSHADGPPYVYVIGSDRLSSDLHAINEEANRATTRMELDYTFNERNDPNRFYFRSDHYNFARKGVPAIFYFSGVHEDYHQPGDTVDKILFDLLHQRALLVFHTAWRLSNREERIVVDGDIE